MPTRCTGLPDLNGRRRGVRVAGRHQIRAQAAARHRGRPDKYRGEKLGLGAVLLPIATFVTISLAMETEFPHWQIGVSSDLPLALKQAIKAPVHYPPQLSLPEITELAFMTPPLPSKRASLPRPRLRIAAQGFPVALSLPERVLPPLPKFKMTVLYPPQLSLPEITELAFMTPPLPSKRGSLPRPRLRIAAQGFPVALSLPERVLPPLPKLKMTVLYPPRLVLPEITRPVLAAAPLLLPPNPTEPRPEFAKPATDGAGAESAHGVCRVSLSRFAARGFDADRGQRPGAAFPASLSGHGDRGSGAAAVATNPWPAMAAPRGAMPLHIGPERFAPLNEQEAFGLRLVAAVKTQMHDMTFYNPAYIAISYPMGDVPPVYGVCSDVVVRAYRQLGFDLQELVHRAGLGSGDTSIDHRRTKVLRNFFMVYADTLPITDYPEDYKPGDIVSYFRPFGRSSKYHIAIVSDDLAPSGRPYLLHNRAWGVQKEDALFADEITGHYRFSDLRAPLPAKRPRRGQVIIAASTRKHRTASMRRAAIAKRAPAVPRRHGLPLCSPNQPLSVRLRVADLCFAGRRKAMGLGMNGHLAR